MQGRKQIHESLNILLVMIIIIISPHLYNTAIIMALQSTDL